ncbi:hypothetical protein EDD86DRAFT_247543 [Gorgonomyces haynaldii]|nr:hypothetical protein EDD86DRAFT_247543 [Gorgonomyces haynaldii]
MSQPYQSRSSSYLYISSVFHGVAFTEATCCAYLLLSKLFTDNGVWKTPIFIVSTLSLLFAAPVETPDNPFWLRYYKATQIFAVVVNMPQILTHCVILFRMSAFSNKTSKEFVAISVLSVVHGICWLANAYLGYITNSQPAFYLAPTYGIWMLTNGICIATDSVINISAACIFLLRIASAMSISGFKMIRTIVTTHDGLRWLTLIGMNIYILSAVAWAVLYDSATFSTFLALYTFLQSSYVAAKQIIEQNTVAKRRVEVTTLGTLSVT